MKKGFTLIELLAVIVILAIIALISVPMVLNAVDKASKASYVESLRGILEATDIYVASDDFTGIPDEGIEVTDENIKMKNKSFTSGKVFVNDNGELELEKVSDGSYCGGGTLKNIVVIESSCENLDITGPTLSVATNSLTSSSVTVVATANDPESDISGYQFSKDNGETWTDKQASNVYDFTGLTNGQTYQIKVKVYNDNVSLVLSTTKLVEITTVDIPEPTYSVDTTDWSQSKTVTITYPERHEGYVYEYSLDSASTWTEVPDPDLTKEITFDANGSVIARISDGTNEINGTTYEVTQIDTTAPVITVNPAVVSIYKGLTYTDSGVTANDDPMGDITSDIVTTGSVNTSTAGTYTLSYNVSDAAGNAAIEVIRQVNVVNGTFTFTNAGATGRTGPTQSQVNSTYSGTTLASDVTVSSGSQFWTVPVTGTYRIEVWGAEGGSGNKSYSSSSYSGGKGARMRGDFQLAEGTQLKILVGQRGQNGDGGCSQTDAGGGGGTFVTKSDNTPLIIAGGGGGGPYYAGRYYGSYHNGQTGTAGGRSYNCSSIGTIGGLGSYCSTSGGSPGNGLSGSSVTLSNSGTSGTSFISGGYGGYGTTIYPTRPNGGFGSGGGGGHGCCWGSGGGGGYSGGTGDQGCGAGGGGGSYNAGTNQSNSSGVNTGHGKAVITFIG